MNLEVFAVLPPARHVIRIYVRCKRLEFAVGFCRQIMLFERHVEFVAPFRRATNASMTVSWAECLVPEKGSIEQYSFAFCPEEKWMVFAGLNL